MDEGYTITKDMFAAKMNILIYGEPGSGKTYLAGTAQDVPEMANIHVFNVDGGIMTLAERGDIRATNIRSVDDLEKELYRAANPKDEKYKDVRTIVIDNLSELQILSLEEKTRREFEKRRKNDKQYTIDNVYVEDYGESTKQLARVLRSYRDLPIHVIYTAHKKDKMRKGTQILEESKPNLTDKLCTSVMGYMDMVWYLYTQDEVEGNEEETRTITNRYLLTQPVNNYHAKTRGDKFPRELGIVVKNPTFSDIWQVYRG